jgi:hypothetical protein
LPGLTRQSIPFRQSSLMDSGMDARIKSGHDEAEKVGFRLSRE